jgi:hypothetical protein
VLGVGRVLLHETVADALARHRITAGMAAGAVSTFAAADGSPNSLVVGSGDRPATLEEVVLGYLASARPSVGAAA